MGAFKCDYCHKEIDHFKVEGYDYLQGSYKDGKFEWDCNQMIDMEIRFRCPECDELLVEGTEDDAISYQRRTAL